MPTVLIADDSLSVRKVAERQLVEAGLDVALAANGEEALSWMSSKHPDLVIADVIMPDKSGFEVCAFVKSHASLADTPVLLVSGFVDDEVTRQAEACQADGIIKKPFQGTSLRERVLGLLSARKEQVLGAAPALAIATPQDETLAPAASDLTAAPVPAQFQAWESRIRAFQERVTHALTSFDKQLQTFHERFAQTVDPVKVLEAQLAEQANRLAQFEHKMHSFREGTAQAVTQVQDLETRLEEEERQSVTLREQLAGLGPGRESITQTLTDMDKQLQDLRESSARITGLVQMLQTRVAEQEKRLTVLGDRLAVLEPIATSAERLVQALASFAAHPTKPAEEGKEQKEQEAS